MMQGRRRMGLLATGAMTLVLCAASLAAPGAALANTVAITSVSQSAPYVGESVTLQALAEGTGCGSGFEYDWSVDSGATELADTPASGPSTFGRSFTTTGDHVVSVGAKQADCPVPTDSRTIHVVNAIAGSIAASPTAPGVGQTATLTANVSGGFAPLSYAWDTTNGGTFTPGGASIPVSFSTTGSHTVNPTRPRSLIRRS